jgi:glutamate 5-kinase
VVLRGPDGGEVGRGLVGYDATEAVAMIGLSSKDIPAVIGYAGRAEIVHRDDMALASG